MAGPVLIRTFRTLRSATLAVVSGRLPAPVQPVPSPTSCALFPVWRTCRVRTLQVCSALYAGHNKWSKVKNIKGPKDEARGKMFMKFGMLIRIAVKGKCAVL